MADDKRERILGAALRVFARSGVHGTAVPPIAAEAGVGVGTLYHYFEGKEALVNAVFRDAKGKLMQRLLNGLAVVELSKAVFDEFWARLAAFAQEEPDAFRFLEMQDHHAYLDPSSRAAEQNLLAPLNVLVVQGQQAGLLSPHTPPEVAMALFWGAFVGLFKAERLGYLKPLSAADIDAARDACWALLAGGA